MRRRTEAKRLPLVELRGDVRREGLDAEQRTVEATFYTGAEVMRFPLFEEPFLLSFSMAKGAARLERLNAGAPLLDSHRRSGGVAAVLGVVENARIEGGAGKATLRFSKRQEVDGVWQDIQDGVLRNLSMGVAIHELEELGQDKATKLRRFRATSWEPEELSLLPIGADAGARIEAAAEGDTRPCRILMRGETMMNDTDHDDTTNDTPTEAELAEERAERKREEREAARIGRAHTLAEHLGLGDLQAQRWIAAGTTVEQMRVEGAELRARRQPAQVNVLGEDHDSWGARLDAMAENLAQRAIGAKELIGPAARYQHLSLPEAGLAALEARFGRRVPGLPPGADARRHGSRIIELALSSSDFPNLLANAANKILRPDYEQAMPTYRMLAERQDLPDFKTASVLKVGDFPLPLQVGEEGEIQLGKFSEAKDSYALVSYGRRLLFSFQMLVNDDLSAFGRVMRGAARRLADFENQVWFTLLTSASGVGPTLGDGLALFHATHANIASGVIDVTNLGAARALMQKQTSLDGLRINISPRYLLTSPDRRTVGEQYVTQITPAQGSQASPFTPGGPSPLTVLSDANLTTAAPWYLVADPSAAVSVYGYLTGQTGPSVATRQGFEVLGTEMRVALHFGTAFVDHRGIVRSPGT